MRTLSAGLLRTLEILHENPPLQPQHHGIDDCDGCNSCPCRSRQWNSIEGYFDEVFAVPGLIARIREHDDCDAHVIACFDDTGLDAARCIANGPVVGLCEAGCYTAMMLANNFSIVTTLSRSVPALQKLVDHYGASTRCVSIRASDIPVLELESADSNPDALLEEEIVHALEKDGAEAIVLGCAGMADFAVRLSVKYSVPVIDGVSAAVKMAEALVSMKLTTSRANGYQLPRGKKYSGRFAADKPG